MQRLLTEELLPIARCHLCRLAGARRRECVQLPVLCSSGHLGVCWQGVCRDARQGVLTCRIKSFRYIRFSIRREDVASIKGPFEYNVLQYGITLQQGSAL